MFKYGHHKNGTSVYSFERGSKMLADKVSDGIKYAEDRMEDILKYVKEHNKDYEHIAKNLGKNSGKIALTTLGAGLFAYGLYKLLNK